jgi:hypothetical protein
MDPKHPMGGQNRESHICMCAMTNDLILGRLGDKRVVSGVPADERPPPTNPETQLVPDEPEMPCGHKINSRNLIVCIDGTSNQFGDKVCVRRGVCCCITYCVPS